MKYTTASIAAVTMALTSALPQNSTSTGCNFPIGEDAAPKVGDTFKLVAVPKVANEIECKPIQAINNNLIINAPEQGATCDSDAQVDFATFYLNGLGGLFLNTNNNTNLIQQIAFDRSGMGQGVIQYTTNAQELSKNQERGPFQFGVNNDLLIHDPNGKDTEFQACPGAADGGWEVWVAGVEKPAGIEGCVKMNARAVKVEDAATCSYSVYNNDA
jgi:hypothetical protein